MRVLKDQLKTALVKSGFLRASAGMLRPAVVILRYHSIQDDPARHIDSIGAGITHSSAVFQRHMEIVCRNFDPVSISDVLAFVNGERCPPPRPVAVTFDDGFVDNFEIAAPILNRYGIRATFYVTLNPVETGQAPWFCRLRYAFNRTKRQSWRDSAESCERSLEDSARRKAAFLIASARCARKAGLAQEHTLATIERELDVEPLSANLMMTWEQVQSLHQSGHTVGSHTLTHPNVACLEPEDALRECYESKAILEQKLGTRVDHFSYPSPYLEPHWTKRTVDITAAVGYLTAVTCTGGPVRRGSPALFLRRVVVPSEIDEFSWVLESAPLR